MRLCCWDLTMIFDSVFLFMVSIEGETHCSVLQTHNFGSIVHTMEGVSCKGRVEAEWGYHNRVKSLVFLLCYCQSESPQIVLLCAGAFPQSDVVHSHLSNLAPPTLPLQDDLGNSSNMYTTINKCWRNVTSNYPSDLTKMYQFQIHSLKQTTADFFF